MDLRSKKNPDSKSSNIVRVKVDRYEYWFDLLDLKVYDEKANEYTIKEVLEKPFTTASDLITIYNELNKKITGLGNSLNTSKIETERLVGILSETVKALNEKVSKLENEISILNNKLKYFN